MRKIDNLEDFIDEYKKVNKGSGIGSDMILNNSETHEGEAGYLIHRAEAFPYSSIGWGEIQISDEILKIGLQWMDEQKNPRKKSKIKK